MDKRFTSPAEGISPKELFSYQHILLQDMQELLPGSKWELLFPSSLSQEFPRSGSKVLPLYLPEENKLLIPLTQGKKVLGLLLGRSVRLQNWSDDLQNIIHFNSKLWLKTLCLQKKLGVDTLTGLFNLETFLQAIGNEIESIKLDSQYGPRASSRGEKTFHVSFGVLYLDIDSLRSYNDNFGYKTGNLILTNIAKALKVHFQHLGPIARLKDDEFGVLIPGASAAKLKKTATEIAQHLLSSSMTHPVTGKTLCFKVRISGTNYPKDFSGAEFTQTSLEQAHIVLDKSRLALKRTWGGNRVLLFSEILRRGGRILKQIDYNHYLLNIGHRTGVEEGQTYAVLDNSRQKGELVVVEVSPEHCIAELLIQESLAPLAVDDPVCLTSRCEEEPLSMHKTKKPPKSVKTIFGFRDFMTFFQNTRAKLNAFTLALMSKTEGQTPADTAEKGQNTWKGRSVLAKELLSSWKGEIIIGALGSDKLIIFSPNLGQQQTLCQLQALLTKRFPELQLTVALADFPCLDYSRSEIFYNCRKAYAHAKLLDNGSWVCFNSTSLTISADNLYNQGELVRAIEEYQRAILLDPDNLLARNSLGVCLARLGQHNQAFQTFQEVLNRSPQNYMALYNFGYVNYKLGEFSLARTCFEKCSKIMTSSPFPLLRLAQLALAENKPQEAKKFAHQALPLEGASGLAHLFLAKSALAQGNVVNASKHLHQSLVHNPRQEEAMFLLAKIYCQEHRDLDIAETLIKQVLEIAPMKKEYLKLLHSIYLDQGKKEMASELAAMMD